MNVRGEGYYFWRERDLGGRLLAGGERYGEVAGREPIFGGSSLHVAKNWREAGYSWRLAGGS